MGTKNEPSIWKVFWHTLSMFFSIIHNYTHIQVTYLELMTLYMYDYIKEHYLLERDFTK